MAALFMAVTMRLERDVAASQVEPYFIRLVADTEGKELIAY